MIFVLMIPKVEVGPNSSKQQLLDAVGKHFMSQVRWKKKPASLIWHLERNGTEVSQ
jgi:hypothetical protein